MSTATVKKPRMTAEDIRQDLRTRGMPMSTALIYQCIKNGKFPFVTVLNVGVTGRISFLVLRKDYETWADENIGPVLKEVTA